MVVFCDLFRIRLQFGNEVIKEDGNLDREVLGRRVFHDKNLRYRLNRIMHPLISLNLIWKVLYSVFISIDPVIVLDVPLLYETKSLKWLCKYIVVVNCEEEIQLNRLLMRNPELNEVDARNRMNSQMSLKEKVKIADFVVDNNGSMQELHSHVDELFNHDQLRPKNVLGMKVFVRLLTCLPLVTILFQKSKHFTQ
uniref:Dephospho-CoA kinase n=1 Tax=Timspurckia oligopyrenoides TaxID=708627 RepID=A0A7S0ZBV5_9RHOD|mmetsp:Transcript_11659/g.21105  ORF Transcript_11659/g.21105 Transcript_11659/m.21105 type:complete len:195 (+) Transcript_11659:143-727(+)